MSDLGLKINFLREQDIFQDLSASEVEALQSRLVMVNVSVGHDIFYEGNPIETFYLLKQGSVRLYRIGSDGRRLELAMLEAGIFFGDVPLGESKVQRSCAEAATDGLICVISRDNLADILNRYPKIAIRMVSALNARVGYLQDQLSRFAQKDIAERVAAMLLERGRSLNTSKIRITHQELADMTGSSRETVTRSLAIFKAMGILKTGRGVLTIINFDALRAQIGSA